MKTVDVNKTLESIAQNTPGAQVFYREALEPPAPGAEQVLSVGEDGAATLANIENWRAHRDPEINAMVPNRCMASDLPPNADPIAANNVERSCNEANLMLGMSGNEDSTGSGRASRWWPAAIYEGNTRVSVIPDAFALAGPNAGVAGVGYEQALAIYKNYEASAIVSLQNKGKIDFSPPLLPGE